MRHPIRYPIRYLIRSAPKKLSGLEICSLRHPIRYPIRYSIRLAAAKICNSTKQAHANLTQIP